MDDIQALVSALENIADVHIDSDDRAHITRYAPDSEDGSTEPGSAWDEECDRRIAAVRAELPEGWSAEWSDDDVVITRDDVDCACGEWSGEPCTWSGPQSETEIVEYMPEHLRASHEAAGNRGVYPANGAVRVRVERSCADRMIECDGEWCKKVDAPAKTRVWHAGMSDRQSYPSGSK